MSAWQMMGVEDGPQVRRLSVPGGWLYQVENTGTVTVTSETPDEHVNADGTRWPAMITTTAIAAWHAPVFVPDGDR